MNIYNRLISDTILRLASLYPIISITGPRQSGKTSLAKKLFTHLPYVSFENIDTRQEAI
jgi:predicted AAA+ superfamily ATPase